MRALEQRVASQAEPDNSAEIGVNHDKFAVQKFKKNKIVSRHDGKFSYLVGKGKAVRTSNRNELLLGKENVLTNCGDRKKEAYLRKHHQKGGVAAAA